MPAIKKFNYYQYFFRRSIPSTSFPANKNPDNERWLTTAGDKRAASVEGDTHGESRTIR
jgi:hypothetical protein